MRLHFNINNYCNFCGNELVFARYFGKKLKNPQIREYCNHCGMIKVKNHKYSLFDNIDDFEYVDYSDRRVYLNTFYGRIKNMRNAVAKEYYNNTYLKSKEWIRKRNLVFKRDKGKCRFCNSKGRDVHHITYYNLMSESWLQLITLCRDCHIRVHSDNEYIVNGLVVNYGKLKLCPKTMFDGCETYHNNKILFCDNCESILNKYRAT